MNNDILSMDIMVRFPSADRQSKTEKYLEIFELMSINRALGKIGKIGTLPYFFTACLLSAISTTLYSSSGIA